MSVFDPQSLPLINLFSNLSLSLILVRLTLHDPDDSSKEITNDSPQMSNMLFSDNMPTHTWIPRLGTYFMADRGHIEHRTFLPQTIFLQYISKLDFQNYPPI